MLRGCLTSTNMSFTNQLLRNLNSNTKCFHALRKKNLHVFSGKLLCKFVMNLSLEVDVMFENRKKIDIRR